MRENKNVKTMIRVKPSTRQKIEFYADYYGVTISEYLRRVIEDGLNNEELLGGDQNGCNNSK